MLWQAPCNYDSEEFRAWSICAQLHVFLFQCVCLASIAVLVYSLATMVYTDVLSLHAVSIFCPSLAALGFQENKITDTDCVRDSFWFFLDIKMSYSLKFSARDPVKVCDFWWHHPCGLLPCHDTRYLLNYKTTFPWKACFGMIPSEVIFLTANPAHVSWTKASLFSFALPFPQSWLTARFKAVHRWTTARTASQKRAWAIFNL